MGQSVLKVCGGDFELGNSIVDASSQSERPEISAAQASRALLAEIDGLPGRSWLRHAAACPQHSAKSNTNPFHLEEELAYGVHGWVWRHGHECTCERYLQDFGRKFLPANGGCVYIDLDHLELCVPEVTNAFDHVAAWHAMLRIAQAALAAANRRQSHDRRIVVLVNNSDGCSHSWGGHLSFAISRACFDDIFELRPQYLLTIASHLASAIVYSGAGKVGSENGRAPIDYQISQRADFFETLCGVQTTYRRPLVNARNESLAASKTGLARFHCISFDNTLCHVSSLLKVGATQLVLAMLEAGEIATDTLLDNPLAATWAFSRDPELRATTRTVAGEPITAIELQRRFASLAERFVARGHADGIVPRAREIVVLWRDVLTRLEHAPDSLTGSIDWLLKRSLLQRAMARRGFSWRSFEAKHLDHAYSSLDPDEGLYWAMEQAGHVERVVDASAVDRFIHEPPSDTRAYARAHFLRRAGAAAIEQVDWDAIQFRLDDDRHWRTQSVSMPSPVSLTQAQVAECFATHQSLATLARALAATDVAALTPTSDVAAVPVSTERS
ncbi:MAG: proteasome accessory factor PafA2 family protein [Planctomycetota bacterium]